MSCYTQAASVKGRGEYLRAESLSPPRFYLQVPLCHIGIKMDISGEGGGALFDPNLPLNGSGEL